MEKNLLERIMLTVLVSVLVTLVILAFPAPAFACHCHEFEANIDCAMRVTGSGRGVGDKWRVIEVDSGKVMAAGPGAVANFSFTGQYDVRYKLQFGEDDEWSTQIPCEFYFSPGSVRVSKVWVDGTGNPTGGPEVTVNLFRNNTKVDSGQTPVTFDNLCYADYTLKEEVSPDSKPIGKTEHNFTLDEQQLHFEFQFKNRKVPRLGSVEASKAWVDCADNPSAGPPVTVILFRDGAEIDRGQTPVIFDKLESGSYTLKEEVPAGPNVEPISPTEYHFTINEQQLHFQFQFKNRHKEWGSVTASKAWFDGEGNPSAGPPVTVILFREGAEIDRGQTPVTFDELEPGSYTLKEEVPAGPDVEPIPPTEYNFTIDECGNHYEFQFKNRKVPQLGSVEASKAWLDCAGAPSTGLRVTVILLKNGVEIDRGQTPVIFDQLESGSYTLKEEVPPDSEPISPTEYNFTLAEQQLHFQFQFKNRHKEWGSVEAGKAWFDGEGNPTNGPSVTVILEWDGDKVDEGPTPITFDKLKPGSYTLKEVLPSDPLVTPIGATEYNFEFGEGQCPHFEFQFENEITTILPTCECEVTTDPADKDHEFLKFFVNKEPIKPVLADHDDYIKVVDSNFGCSLGNYFYCGGGSDEDHREELYWPSRDHDLYVEFEVRLDSSAEYVGGPTCRLTHEKEDDSHTTGQYQGFIGPVPFGTYTPLLEPGKEYFDMTQSIMHNVEYLDGSQGDIVFRFNGQEIDGVTTSIFNSGTFRQVESANGRAVTTFNEGATKLIAYRNGVERARIFQTISSVDACWIHPLDQPFEHKYEFELEVHGAPGTTDLLVYGTEQRDIVYDENGLALVTLAYRQPGLVALYRTINPGGDFEWITVDLVAFPNAESEMARYSFAETGLYHYRLVDPSGQVVAGPLPISTLEFKARPGIHYKPQLVYPAASIFVGLYNDMKFEHPDYWTMPIEARAEHEFEFHLDYHRLNDPDLGNDHVRGDVVIEALYLLNATTSVAQQFPYGRHDGVLPGVTLLGIPNVSMVAFCQRPGMHEMVYWGGWEAESYYLPERGIIFDEELYEEWTEDWRGECIDAARRVNMELARQGLRTDHTHRHHGERSQGYQMVQQNIWSPFNLAGMRPPHIGQFLKPGTILPYYESPEDVLFWGWDLENGGLIDGLGAAELQQYIASLGPVEYGDFTGIHPAEALNPPGQYPIPEFVMPTRPTPTPPPTPTPVPPTPIPTPIPLPPTPTPLPPTPTPTPTPEPPTPTPLPPAPTPMPPAPTPLTHGPDPGDQTALLQGDNRISLIYAAVDQRGYEISNMANLMHPDPGSSPSSLPENSMRFEVASPHQNSVVADTVSNEEAAALSSTPRDYLSVPGMVSTVLDWGNSPSVLIIPPLVVLGFMILAGVLNLSEDAPDRATTRPVSAKKWTEK